MENSLISAIIIADVKLDQVSVMVSLHEPLQAADSRVSKTRIR